MRLRFYISFLALEAITILIFACNRGHDSKENHNNDIVWTKTIKLTWNDFKRPAPWIRVHDAQSALWIDVSDQSLVGLDQIEIAAYFRPDSSWAIPEKTSENLLDHEKRHFDIAEITARRFRQYFSEWNGGDRENFDLYIMNVRKLISSFSDSIQNLYDTETNHSLNKEVQRAWDLRIDSILNNLRQYENNKVKVKVQYQKRKY